jgi:hypothetical protein
MCDTCKYNFANCNTDPIFAAELTEPSNNIDIGLETHSMLDAVIACERYEIKEES